MDFFTTIFLKTDQPSKYPTSKQTELMKLRLTKPARCLKNTHLTDLIYCSCSGYRPPSPFKYVLHSAIVCINYILCLLSMARLNNLQSLLDFRPQPIYLKCGKTYPLPLPVIFGAHFLTDWQNDWPSCMVQERINVWLI